MKAHLASGRASRLALGVLLATSMGGWSFAAAAQSVPGSDTGTGAAGCYGNMAHQGTPSPDKCGLQDITTTPSSIAPTLGGNVQGCTILGLNQPVVGIRVASIDPATLPDFERHVSGVLVAGQCPPCNPCNSSDLGKPTFATFLSASLDDSVTVPASARLGEQPVLVGEPCCPV